MLDPIRILAFDPSTDVTGVALLEYPPHGQGNTPRLLFAHAIDAREAVKGDDLRARIDRIEYTRELLYGLLRPCAVPELRPTLIAYETDTGRGHYSSEALIMAAGAYLTLPYLAGLRIVQITRSSACSAVGCYDVYSEPRGRTSAEQKAKIARLKAAVIVGAARLVTGFDSAEFDQARAEAIADAIAVGAAAYGEEIARIRIAVAEEKRKQQLALFGKGSRPRKVVGA